VCIVGHFSSDAWRQAKPHLATVAHDHWKIAIHSRLRLGSRYFLWAYTCPSAHIAAVC
jgi:hypothetical protein